MGRIRCIKPDFPHSESMGRVSRDARLLFIELWTVVDDSGRTRGNSRMLASLLFPYDEDAPTLIDGWLDELEAESCIRRYLVDGQNYIDIPNWLKHQRIDKPTSSKLPEFVESSRKLANPPSRNGKGMEGNGKGSGKGIGKEGNGVPVAVPAPTGETWAAYSQAYETRYQVQPVRNAKVNGLLSALLKRLPAEEAPQVAAFYVGHNRALYVTARHAVDLLLRDCEGLRTEWATGRSVTQTEAMQKDRTQATANVFAPLIEEARRAN